MQALYTAAEVRALESAATTPTRELMERAGRALAEIAQHRLAPDGRVFILCGPGNNGGDGLVAARALREAGRGVEVVLMGEAARLPPDAADAHRRLLAAGGQVRPASTLSGWRLKEGDVVLDALFGIGLNRAPEGALAQAITAIGGFREEGATIVSADVPSGVEGDTGVVHAPSVQADVTVVFGVAKIAHALQPGRGRCGALHLVPLGLPEPKGAPRRALLDATGVRAWLPVPEPAAHKGSFGHVLVVAGSEGKSGAAALSALGALRSGAGLVTVAASASVLPQILAHAPEVMGLPLPLDADGLGMRALEPLVEAAVVRDAVVFGPGIARGEGTHALVRALLERVQIPWVLDADGLNALASDVTSLKRARAPVVLTPHPGELGRLLGWETAEIQADRLTAATALAPHAAASGLTVVLKGAGTVIACADGALRVNPTGHPGMGTGGTGDVLSGVLGALLAGGMDPGLAACLGVYVHGLAGERMRGKTGMRGFIASDLLPGLCRVWREWEQDGTGLRPAPGKET